MRLIKRLVCLVMIFCLLASVALAEGANVSLYQNPLDWSQIADSSQIKRVQSFVTVNGTLYVLTQSALEKWAPGMAEPEVLYDQVRIPDYYYNGDDKAENESNLLLSVLFAAEGRVYVLDQESGQVYLAVDETGACPMTPGIKLEGLGRRHSEGDDYEYLPELMAVCVQDGKLFTLIRDYQTGDYNNPELAAYDLATGAETKLDTKFVKGLCPYKEGQLLLLVQDSEHSWDEEKQQSIPPTLAVLDIATGTATDLLQFEQTDGIFGLAYSAEADTLYYCSQSKVYSLPGMAQPSKLSAYLLGSSWSEYPAALLTEDTYVVREDSCLSVRVLNAASLAEGALTVYGDYGSNQHLAFAQAYPEIPLTLDQDYYDGMEALTNAMVSGETTVDVLCLDTNYSPLERLIDKGYAMDLSGYPELVALVNEMYPQYVQYVQRDGKLYGVPYRVDTSFFCFEKENWVEIGLSEADYPTNFMELLDFIANWEYDYADDYPDVKLSDDTDIRRTLMNRILDSYVAYYVKQGQTLTFDTELLRKLLSKLEEIDFKAMEPASESDSDLNEFWSKHSLMITNMGMDSIGGFASEDNYYAYRALALDEGMEPCLSTNMGVLIINPRTTRVDQAVRYVTSYVQNLDRTSGYLTLFPGHNEPVLNAGYETLVQGWEDELARMKTLLETAAPEDVASIQDSIDSYQNALDHKERNRYYASPEDIAFYREHMAPYLVVTGKTPLNTWDNEGNNDLYTQMNQYLDGAITLDQYLKTVDQRVRMMQLEDQ